jgi:hypothetical protein
MLGERVATPTRSTKEEIKTVAMRNAYQNPENGLTAKVSVPLASIRYPRARCAPEVCADRDHRVDLRTRKQNNARCRRRVAELFVSLILPVDMMAGRHNTTPIVH